MHSVKRIEIIASSKELPKLLDALRDSGVPGYSVIRDVVGRSERGIVSDEFNFASSNLSNVYIICFCRPDQVDPVLQHIQPILQHYGGVCYVSEATAIDCH